MSRSQHLVRAVLTAATLALVVLAAPAASTARSAAITPTTIAGAKLGLDASAYKKLLGTPARYQTAGGGEMTDPGFQQPEGYTRLVFSKRKLNVYFAVDGLPGEIVTTWNKADRTAEGVGPCSSLAQVKAAYGGRLKPNPANSVDGTVYSYIVGRSLIFEFADSASRPGIPSKRVTAVALYDGSLPNWKKPGGPLYVASFIASAPNQVPCA